MEDLNLTEDEIPIEDNIDNTEDWGHQKLEDL